MSRRRWTGILAAMGLVAALACGGEPPEHGERGDLSTGSDSEGESAGAVRVATGPGRLVPATAAFDRVAEYPMDPRQGGLPDDSLLATRIVRGFDIALNTAEEMPRYVGNDMACGNCHLNGGQRELGLPWRGIAGVFPVSRNREGRLFSLEDRIRGCFMRSMNGTQPPFDDPDLLALSAYITWLSRGTPVGESPEWRGRNRIAEDARIPIDELDPAEGEALFAERCAMCHGADGQNTRYGNASPGPLWGDGSWNDGAGFARVYTLAGFIRYAMPLTEPGSLDDRQAQQIAAFIDAQERPAYPRKEDDYPGGAPIDAVYYPRYSTHPLRQARTSEPR